jgi:hypothetical protein
MSEEQYAKALVVYDKILEEYDINADECEQTESEKHPMHPYLFWQLSFVKGFSDKNGKTYDDYLEKYKVRYNSLTPTTTTTTTTTTTSDH